MNDPIIDEMQREIVSYRHYTVSSHVLVRWVNHLRDVVQPQLDELEALKATYPTTRPARQKGDHAGV